MTFEEWREELENNVYVYFSEELDELEQYYGLDLMYYYENDYSPLDVVTEIQSIVEEDDFDDG
jgi:hypothetical protein